MWTTNRGSQFSLKNKRHVAIILYRYGVRVRNMACPINKHAISFRCFSVELSAISFQPTYAVLLLRPPWPPPAFALTEIPDDGRSTKRASSIFDICSSRPAGQQQWHPADIVVFFFFFFLRGTGISRNRRHFHSCLLRKGQGAGEKRDSNFSLIMTKQSETHQEGAEKGGRSTEGRKETGLSAPSSPKPSSRYVYTIHST